MSLWRGQLVVDVLNALGPSRAAALARAPRAHLACMIEPWASLVESGEKLVESRWSKTRRAPHFCIGADDAVIWKRSGGEVYGFSRVTFAETLELADDAEAEAAARAWATRICVSAAQDPRRGMRFATFIGLADFVPVPRGVACGKRDRSGWNVLTVRVD